MLVTFGRLALNPVPKAAGEAVASLFPEDPRYMERGPFSYTDPSLVEKDLRAAGFEALELETVELSSRVSARDAAHGIVLGSPFRAEIERLDPWLLSAPLRQSRRLSKVGTARTHRCPHTSRPPAGNSFPQPRTPVTHGSPEAAAQRSPGPVRECHPARRLGRAGLLVACISTQERALSYARCCAGAWKRAQEQLTAAVADVRLQYGTSGRERGGVPVAPLAVPVATAAVSLTRLNH
jgi:hypothetical protein